MKAINLISIAFGAIAGTYARYLLNLSLLYTGYPIGTVIENLLGSFILGLLTGFLRGKAKRMDKAWTRSWRVRRFYNVFNLCRRRHFSHSAPFILGSHLCHCLFSRWNPSCFSRLSMR